MISRPIVFERFGGRSEELEYLAALRRAAAASRGGVVLIAGEAGIGKSRLIAEFLASIGRHRTRVARGACRHVAQSAFGPLDDALRALDPAYRTDATTIDERFSGVLDALARSAERRTTVIALEDLHWADPVLLELLRAVSTSAANRRLLVVASYRDDEIDADHRKFTALGRLVREPATTVVTLRPLPLDEVERLARGSLRRTAAELPPLAIASVVRSSEGNPLFAEEFLRHAVDRASAPDAVRTVPLSLHGIVRERLAGCSPDERMLLATAALCGRGFDVATLAFAAAISSTEQLEADLARLCRAQLIVASPDGRNYEFRHALTRDAIYSEIDESETRAPHGRIADYLEGLQDAADRPLEIAYHRWRAGDRAGAAFEAAGARARRNLAFADAVAWYERAAAAFAGDEAAVARVLLATGTTLVAAGSSEQAAAIFETVSREARARGDAPTFTRARKLIAGWLANDGRHESAIALLEGTLAELSPQSTALTRIELLIRIANYQALKTDPAEARATLQRIDSGQIGQPTMVRAEYYASLSWLAARDGREAEWRSHFDTALATFQQLETPMFVRLAHVNFAWQALALGHVGIARAHGIAALEACAETAALPSDAPLTMALVALASGELREADQWLERVVPSSDFMSRKTRAICAMELAVERDERLAINEHLDLHLLDEADAIDDRYGMVRLAVAFARGLDALERVDEANLLYGRAASAVDSTYQFVPPILTIARRRPAYAAQLRAVLAADEARSRSAFLRSAIAMVDAEIALHAGDEATVRTRAESARSGFAQLGWRAFTARSTELAGDQVAALAAFRQAGYVGEARRIEQSVIRESGVPRTLTMREQEVARLVAGGASNRAAAAALLVSEKTIEKHLAAVYAKLGLTSRTALRTFFPPKINPSA